MTDLVRSQQQLATARKLSDVMNDRRRWLLLDYSSSMDAFVNFETRERRIDALRATVKSLREVEQIRFRQMLFGASVEVREDIPEPAGGTPLAQALMEVKAYNPSQVCVVSDGEPAAPDLCLQAAAALGVKIDVFYIGPPGGHGEDFLRKLAEASGGRFASNDLSGGVKALTSQVRDSLLALPPAVAL